MRLPLVALALLPATGFASFALAKFAPRHFGGITGDTYAFIIAVLEPWILLCFVLLLRR